MKKFLDMMKEQNYSFIPVHIMSMAHDTAKLAKSLSLYMSKEMASEHEDITKAVKMVKDAAELLQNAANEITSKPEYAGKKRMKDIFT